jgi:D-3-phosphoglycerate dehydrogenase / 2-oxoglutarate reductase
MPESPDILIIDPVHPVFMERMEAHGYSCDYLPAISPEQVHEIINRYKVLVVRTKMTIGRELIGKAEQLRLIARAGAGMDNVDEAAAKERGVVCINAPEGNRDAVAEHVIGMLLSLFRKITQASAQVKEWIWDREANRGIELKGMTIGLVGYGNTGRAVAKKLSGFDVRVLAYDKYLENYSDNHAVQAGMDEIFEKSDVLSLHIPLTPETKKLVNDLYLSRFKKPVFLVNTSRGKIVDTPALVKALGEGKVRGIALDVLEEERLENFSAVEKEWFEKLTRDDNVLITPHIAGWTTESYYKIAAVLAEKLVAQESILK